MLFLLIQDQKMSTKTDVDPYRRQTCTYDRPIEALSVNVYMEILRFELCEKHESATLL